MLNKLAPNWTYHKVEDLLLIPNRKKTNRQNTSQGIDQFVINTPDGAIHGYKCGRGPTVVLVHGWSGGAYQFFPLMRGLAQIGFKAVSFDHFGHGQSDDTTRASLQRFISATNIILKYVKTNSDELAAVVAHSMGCIAVANAHPNFIRETPLLFISPIFNFKKYFTKQVNLLGFDPELSKKYLSRFEDNYRGELDQMELAKKLKDYAANTVIAHDKSDEEGNILDSMKFCSANPLAKLHVTKGYGHTRIINSESVWQQLKSHLNYEDITASRFQECS